jgi:hypothetical protein
MKWKTAWTTEKAKIFMESGFYEKDA